MKTSPLLYVACLLALCVTLFWAGATAWADAPAQSSGADKAPLSAAAQSADAPKDKAGENAEEKVDPYAVPEDADPAKLIEFIETLQKMRPKGLEESREMRTKLPPAIIAAADKILSGDATDDQALTAAKAKMTALRHYRSDPASADKLSKFIEEMKQDKRPAIANYAYTMGMVEAAMKWSSLDEEAKKAFFADVPKAFATDRLEVRQYYAANMIGSMLERNGDTEASLKFFDEVVPLFTASKDSELAALGAKFEGVVRRLKLPGNEMEVTGQLLDGSTFDWGSYRGKVVLVDFWATWCGPCVHELPNVLKEYELYHDKGFDVVGISLDDNKTKLENFVKERGIPWAILYNEKPNGWNTPMATYYGINAIPRPILVNQEGKVVSMNARGEALGDELEKLLGKVESPDEPEKESAESKKAEESAPKS